MAPGMRSNIQKHLSEAVWSEWDGRAEEKREMSSRVHYQITIQGVTKGYKVCSKGVLRFLGKYLSVGVGGGPNKNGDSWGL